MTLAGNVVQMNAEILAALDDPATAPARRAGGLRRASDGAGHEDGHGLDQHGRGRPDVGRLRRDRPLLRPADRSNGICTDACTPDPMATLEKWANGYLPLMAGANVNGGAGSLACVGTVSLRAARHRQRRVRPLFPAGRRGCTFDDATPGGRRDRRGGSGQLIHHGRPHAGALPRANTTARRWPTVSSAPAWEAAGGQRCPRPAGRDRCGTSWQRRP